MIFHAHANLKLILICVKGVISMSNQLRMVALQVAYHFILSMLDEMRGMLTCDKSPLSHQQQVEGVVQYTYDLMWPTIVIVNPSK